MCLLKISSFAVFVALAGVCRAGDSNVALSRPVTASGVTAGGAAAAVTDGDSSTYTAPSAAGVVGFYYQIDLGKEYPLQAIDLYSRVNDAANKLSRVRMAVYSDNAGVPGVERWGYEIRADGSNNLQGGVDRLLPSLHPTGTMRGRFIRLTNVANVSNAPQIAEIEAFEAPAPEVKYFGPDAGNITKTGAPGKPSQAGLSWNVSGATAISLDQSIGPVTGPTGTLVVSPATTTTYTLTARNGAGAVSRSVTIGVDEPELPPFISEFLASNGGGIRDSEGKRQDWVEIGNPNAFALNLSGFFLTDNPLLKRKWTFPPFTVPGNGYAIVFASNTTTPRPLLETPHTNFNLSAAGEYLGLIARDGTTVLSQFPMSYPAELLYPPQEQDHSYGVTAGVPGYYAAPTPAAANGIRYDGVVADTVFNLWRGIYTAPQSVSITCDTPGAQIRYTTDGSNPTATTGTVYTEALTVNSTRVIKVAAFKPGWAPTNVDIQTFVFPADIKSTAVAKSWLAPSVINGSAGPPAVPALTDAQMEAALREIPSMCLTVPPGTVIDGGVDKLAKLEWLDPLGVSPGFQIPCGVQLFGGAFTNFAKKSYRISFKGEYGASNLNFPLFQGHDRGWPATEQFDQIELRNGSHDMTARGFYMSNAFTDATMLDMGSYAPHSRFVHLYLNGSYWGMYQLRERFAAAMMASYYGGDSTDYESINGNLNAGGWAIPGLPYDGTDAQWTMMKDLARSGGNTYEKLRPFLDVPQYVDYMIMFMFGKSEDEYRTTGPVGAGHGYKFVLNDADGYLFYAPYAGPGIDRTVRDAPGRKAGDGPGSLFSMLYKDGGADYRTLLADRIHRSFAAPGGAMTPAANIARLNGLCNAIQQSMTIECARWNYQTPARWAAARADCLNWFNTRTTDILNIYRNTGFYPTAVAPVFSLPAGPVASGTVLQQTTTSPGGTVYYTTNGLDPRLDAAALPNTEFIGPATSGRIRVPLSAGDGVTLPETSDLMALYALDDGAADAVCGFNGTLTNGAALAAPGKLGAGAASFDGVNDNVQLGNPEALRFTGQITMAAWVKPASTNNFRTIVSRGSNAAVAPAGETFLRIGAGAWQGGFAVGATTPALAAGPATGTNSAFADLGRWTHVAIVHDGTAWRLYRNGVEISSVVSAGGAPANTTGWAIGARGPGDLHFWNGQIDEVRLYKRGLTPVEVAALAAGSVPNPAILWNQPGMDDSLWTPAAGALGFAPPGDALAAAISQDVGASLLGINASLYQRYTFPVSAVVKSELTALELRIKSDDGYVVYLNGTQVASRNVAGFPSGTSTASAETPDLAAIVGDRVSLTPYLSRLVAGDNVLAVHGLNRSAADDDFLLSTELYGQRGLVGLLPGAQPAGTGLALTRSTLVRSRTWLPATSSWSALQETFYQVGPSPCPPGALAVSELHYHPFGDGDGEFIELMNVSDAAINLRGVQFSLGVEFQFPTTRDWPLAPGQRVVLVDSELTFQRIHGWSAPLGGIFRGAFDNAGERVLILAADGVTPLVDFTYDDGPPWPGAADGLGSSLVLINPSPTINPALPSNWRVSTRTHGNPNRTDALSYNGIPGADADSDSLTSLMEFALGTSDGIANPLPATLTWDALGRSSISLDHANGADTAALSAQASSDLSLWNVPLELTARSLLPDGRLRSTWRAVLPTKPAALFYRFRTP
jgi:Concanavalin A-like lectin/glucanases superfamily/CotH kinase protein/Chitobiase/beta-hexosaminidase C-terminal domain